ncbi:MAG: hypothetical protein HY403_01770 [Elusimicrobia bacterium]|nr:hypothetical protein [Elusimicrobiota bacterium]
MRTADPPNAVVYQARIVQVEKAGVIQAESATGIDKIGDAAIRVYLMPVRAPDFAPPLVFVVPASLAPIYWVGRLVDVVLDPHDLEVKP